ncbi:hypothetical protein C0J52_07695 [Blattella germanica]|nr:hypothetical protein C0J52_07695 [Blattella germanica]
MVMGRMENDEFCDKIVFSHEAGLFLSGKVNRHNFQSSIFKGHRLTSSPPVCTICVVDVCNGERDGDGDLQMSSDLDIVAVGTSPGTNDEPAQHCRLPYRR